MKNTRSYILSASTHVGLTLTQSVSDVRSGHSLWGMASALWPTTQTQHPQRRIVEEEVEAEAECPEINEQRGDKLSHTLQIS